MSIKRRLDELAELGVRNQEIIDLVGNHCRHARVEKSPLMGQGMAEATSGLPIDGREIRCPNAGNGSMAGMNLEGIAVDFYRRNCVGCEHRDPVGLPNLKGLVEGIDAQNRRDAEAVAEREGALDDARDRRAIARRERAAGEPEPTRSFVALLDGVDAREPDERADRLVDLARAGREVCTRVAADLVMETALAAPNPQLVEAISHLWRHGSIDGDEAVEASLVALSTVGPIRVAAELMVELRERVTAESVRPAIRALLALAGPSEWFGDRRAAYGDGLAVAASVDLPAVLDELLPLIESEEKYTRASGASAAQTLLGVEPAASSLLVRPLLRALSLPGSHDSYVGSPREPLLAALRQALIAEPVGTSATVLELGGRMAEEERESVVGVFEGVVRRRGEVGVGSEVLENAVDACMQIADGRWGERAARAAADALELFASREPEALLPHADALLGILMGAVAQPLSVDPLPGLEGLVRAGAQALRSGRLSKLTEAIGELVKYNPAALRDQVLAVLDAEDPPGEEAIALRRELVGLLAAFGTRQDGLGDVLPRLYSALLHEDSGVRAAGIKAWRELARSPGFKAPTELEDLILSLLGDPYVAVHTAMVTALLFGLRVPDRHLQAALLTVLKLAEVYASKDGYFLDDILSVGWRLSCRFESPISTSVQRKLLALAEHLTAASDLERMLSGLAGEVRGPEMTDRLIEAVSRDAEDPADHGLAELLRLLREQPSDLLSERVEAIRQAARRYVPLWPESAAPLVEVLQDIGRYDLAVELAEEIVGAIPDTSEQASRRVSAMTVLSAARVELAIISRDSAGVQEGLESWRTENEQLDALRRMSVQPWDVEE